MLTTVFRHSESGSPRLRIGLLINSTQLASCFAEVVDQIQECNFADIELVVLNGEVHEKASEVPQKRSIVSKVSELLGDSQRRKTFFFDMYQRWDKGNIRPATDPHAAVDCTERFKNVETMTVVPIRKRFVHRFPPEAIERIREKQLDVLIRFGFNILRGEILKSAKYGVWSYHHGDGDSYRGGPAHFWEVYEGNPISGAMLQVLTEKLDDGKVLCKGLFATSEGISKVRNSVTPYWGVSSFMIQKLRELHQYGWEHVERNALPAAPYLGKKQIYTSPTNLEMVQWLGAVFARKCIERVTRKATTIHWRLAMRTGKGLALDCGSEPDMKGFRWIDSPKGHFYADPFLFEEGGKLWLFFEDFDYGTKLGRICCAEVVEGGIGEPIAVLETPYHLSYPCIFRVEDSIYMIPETGANSTVELYRCRKFPDQWEKAKVLYEGQAVDTTVWIEDGIYWFFVTVKEPKGKGTQLWLFSSSAVDGEWTAHPANPISTDVRNSRGAGAIFRQNGKLYRPSQDCSKCYGYSFSLNEIVVWDRERYEEKTCATVDPTWAEGLVCTHSYSRVGQVEIIDGCVALATASVSHVE